MSVSADFRDYVLEQLAGLGAVQARRMFGGVGLYHDSLFFGLIDDDTLFLKVDDATRGAYQARGMKPFCPFPDKPDQSMNGYYTVPAEVLEEGSELAAWARQACAVALRAAARKAGKTRIKGKTGAIRAAGKAGGNRGRGKTRRVLRKAPR